MKFRINQPLRKKQKPEPIVVLNLEKSGDSVIVTATMENGQKWHLLILNSNGTFTRSSSIPKDIKFKVTKAGYLKEQK